MDFSEKKQGGTIRKGLLGQVAMNWEPGKGPLQEREANAKALFDR